MATKIDVLLRKYEEQFRESFPLMLCRGMDDEEICATVQTCLDENKPYAPALSPMADY